MHCYLIQAVDNNTFELHWDPADNIWRLSPGLAARAALHEDGGAAAHGTIRQQIKEIDHLMVAYLPP